MRSFAGYYAGLQKRHESINFVDQEYPDVIGECMTFDDYITSDSID